MGRIGDRIVAGSSGQPIDDITKVGGLEEATPLDWLERTLIWRHFAPTAPDTLPAYPYFGTDPFVMRECPDIYFVGNMEKYDTKLYLGKSLKLLWSYIFLINFYEMEFLIRLV